MEQHIHFWLGKNANHEKWYSAAYKCWELDGYAGGKTTQHREVQGKESRRFKSYFERTGIRILSGISETLLIAAQPYFKPRLFKVEGNRVPFLIQFPNLTWTHFKSDCVFLLQTEKTIFIWIGRVANYGLKRNAVAVSLALSLMSGFIHTTYTRIKVTKHTVFFFTSFTFVRSILRFFC